MHQDSIKRGGRRQRDGWDVAAGEDVRFDMPPRLGGAQDRCMAQRAEAQWRALLPPRAAMPSWRAVATGAASAFGQHALLLDVRRGDRVDVLFAGAAVTETFGIGAGVLAHAGGGGLAALLIDACTLVRRWQAIVPVEATLDGAGGARVLTRGVLLPLADDEGALGYVHCVLNGKQLLDGAASARLRREIDAAVRGDKLHFAAFRGPARRN